MMNDIMDKSPPPIMSLEWSEENGNASVVLKAFQYIL